MDQKEREKYIGVVIGLSVLLTLSVSAFVYMLYSNYRYEHQGKLTHGLIIDKREISGSSNEGYWVSYRADTTRQEIFFQSQESYSVGDSVRIYYLADDPRSIKFADDRYEAFGLIGTGCMIFVFGFIFIMTLCFPETMIGYFDNLGA